MGSTSSVAGRRVSTVNCLLPVRDELSSERESQLLEISFVRAIQCLLTVAIKSGACILYIFFISFF